MKTLAHQPDESPGRGQGWRPGCGRWQYAGVSRPLLDAIDPGEPAGNRIPGCDFSGFQKRRAQARKPTGRMGAVLVSRSPQPAWRLLRLARFSAGRQPQVPWMELQGPREAWGNCRQLRLEAAPPERARSSNLHDHSSSLSLDIRQRPLHDQIVLRVVTELENLRSDHPEPPFLIKMDGARIVLPH